MLAVLGAAFANALSSPDGPPVQVWVAARDLTVGDAVGDGDVETRQWPQSLAPDAAIDADSSATPPAGVVTAPLPRGAVVTDHHLGEHALAQLISPGDVGVPVPAEQLPNVTSGTRLDLIGATADGAADLIATDAVVVLVESDTVWLALSEAAAPTVSAAVARSSLAAVVAHEG